MENTNIIYITPNQWQTVAVDKIAKALAKFNDEFAKTKLKQDANSYRNTYVSLDNILNTIRPILAKNELFVHQHLAGDYITTTVVHSSGQFMGSQMEFIPMESGQGSNKTNALQNIGGGITYAKRYAISALLMISSDKDDDGESMGGFEVSKPRTTKRSTTKKAASKSSSKKTLDPDVKNWMPSTVKYIKDNKASGLDVIAGHLSAKYTMDDKAIANVKKILEDAK
jgi:hypothetical protein